MRTTSWTKHTVLLGLAAAIAAGCSSDSNPSITNPDAGISNAVCGNNKVEAGELCDGTNLDNKNCQTAGMGTFTGGTLQCGYDCKGFIISGCTPSRASNGGSSGAGTISTGGAPSGRGGASSGGRGGKGGSGGTSGSGGTGGSGGSGGTAGHQSVPEAGPSAEAGPDSGMDSGRNGTGGIPDAGKPDANDAKAP